MLPRRSWSALRRLPHRLTAGGVASGGPLVVVVGGAHPLVAAVRGLSARPQRDQSSGAASAARGRKKAHRALTEEASGASYLQEIEEEAESSAANLSRKLGRFVRKHDPLCIAVVDSSDFEGSCLSSGVMKQVLGGRDVVLALTKIDRLPGLPDSVFNRMQKRFQRRIPQGGSLAGAHAVSVRYEVGLAELAQRAYDHKGDVFVLGRTGAGKSELVRCLAKLFEAETASPGTLDEMASSNARLWPDVPYGDALSTEDSEGGVLAPTTRWRKIAFGVGAKRTLWDTPGLPNKRGLDASVPQELVEPFVGDPARRARIRHPERLFARPGDSIVLYAPNSLHPKSGPVAFARFDLADPEAAKVASSTAPTGTTVAGAEGTPEDGAAVGGFLQRAREIVLRFLPFVTTTAVSDGVKTPRVRETESPTVPEATRASRRPNAREPDVLVFSHLPPFVRVEIQKTGRAPQRLLAQVAKDAQDVSASALAGSTGSDQTGKTPAAIELPFSLLSVGGGQKGDADGGNNLMRSWDAKYLKGHGLDVAIPGLGFIAMYKQGPKGFAVKPHGLEGTLVVGRPPMYLRPPLFPLHMKREAIDGELASGRLMTGVLRQKKPGSARVVGCGPGMLSSILVRGMDGLNRALHGDMVAVRLLPREEWVTKKLDAGAAEEGVVALAEEEVAVDEDGALAIGDHGAATSLVEDLQSHWGDGAKKHLKPLPVCEVVGIIKRNELPFAAVLDPGSAVFRDTHMVARRLIMPRLILDKKSEAASSAETGQLYAVRLDSWDANSRFPTGSIAHTIGPVGDTSAESAAILVENDVRSADWKPEELATLPDDAWAPTDEDVRRRLDLREGEVGEAVCSVDPPKARDIDDALHAIELERGADGKRRYQVGVHIADVCHFIHSSQALDGEAAKRGTTFYLVDQRVNMLPSILGENVGSLHAGADRFAFSVLWEIDEDANIISSSIAKTIIRSRAALEYREAQHRIDAAAGAAEASEISDPLTRSLSILYSISHKLRERRTAGGALRLASPEIKFDMDEEPSVSEASRNPVGMGLYMPVGTNEMVEEFMLLANISAAKAIIESFPETALLRRHPHPQPENFNELAGVMKQHGLELDLTTPSTLATSLDACHKEDEPYFNLLTRYMAVRCMPAAEYVCAGEIEEMGESYAHFGLSTPLYSHFTSPIRRYSDQIVHRMLAASIGWEEPDPVLRDAKAMSALASSLNERRAASREAERASVKLYAQVFFRGREVIEEGYATGLFKSGMSVIVPRYGIESFLHVMDKQPSGQPSPFKMDPDEKAIVASDLYKIRALDRVKVRVSVDASRLHPYLKMELLDPETEKPLIDVLNQQLGR